MDLVSRLRHVIVRGPVEAALAARDQVAQDLAAAAAIADDAELEMPVRVAALLSLAIVAHDAGHVPDRALEALEDDLLVDAILDAGASGAITGVLAAAGEGTSERSRRYLALRLNAAGATGLHVAALLFSVGERDGAVRAAAPELAASLRGASADDPIVLALATIVREWERAHPGVGERLRAALSEDARATLARAMAAVASTIS